MSRAKTWRAPASPQDDETPKGCPECSSRLLAFEEIVARAAKVCEIDGALILARRGCGLTIVGMAYDDPTTDALVKLGDEMRDRVRLILSEAAGHG